ncbi:hypothetical protein [Nocardia otitidiscaviarum]|uniref:hypothetical protein n=1 Tax=Nocardia otitidiscaviarum TaxID=1823 RepID=UPI002457FDBF|nr:hypothetical protein [Nocardia otitidiscaviarum]
MLSPNDHIPRSSLAEWRITYRDPATDEAYTIHTRGSDWEEQRYALYKAGYHVTTEARADADSPWKVIDRMGVAA